MEILFIVVVSFLCLLILAILAAFAFSRRLRKRISERIIRQRIDADETLQAAKADLKNVLTERTQALHDCEMARQTFETINERRTAALASMKQDINHYAELAKQKVDSEIKEWTRSAQEAANFNSRLNQRTLLKAQDEIVSQTSILSGELEQLVLEIEDYKKQRQVINEEIQRSRAIKENQAFYQIQLDDAAKHDIQYLINILDHFNNKEAIYKIIWTEYLQQPFKQMLNRVLGNTDPKNVIYMIKNLQTEEIYIGKTKAEVSKRWTEHIKTSLNIGQISRTNIHKALYNNWSNFAFTILEKVPVDANLNEREKFYIKFYGSDTYGYNIKSGG